MTPDAVVSQNNPNISYKPVRSSARKGAHERTIGHEWRCMDCCEIVHEEPMIGFDHEETEAEVGARHLRIQTSCKEHQCKLEKSVPVGSGSSVAGEDDPDLPPETE